MRQERKAERKEGIEREIKGREGTDIWKKRQEKVEGEGRRGKGKGEGKKEKNEEKKTREEGKEREEKERKLGTKEGTEYQE